jgi:predicted transglutaminase-like cysteine proteinase
MKDIKAVLDEIFSKTIRRFRYVKDIELWHKREHWESPEEIPDEGLLYGDCDCFALACRKECRKQNIQSRLVLCGVYNGSKLTGHLVLEVQGWILCCRQIEVMPNVELEYEWISISGYKKGDPWRYIHPDKELWSKIKD